MRPSTKKRDIAIRLRKNGFMYSEIASKLDLPRSTVFSWLRTLELTNKELELTKQRLKKHRSKSSIRLLQAKSLKKRKILSDIDKNASLIVADLSRTRSVDIALLAMLFWGEGQKDTSAGIRFINSDPKMIAVFLRLLRKSFNLDESKFRVLLQLHEYHEEDGEIEFWSKVTSVSTKQFHKPYLKTNTGKRKKQDFHGTASVRYADYKLGKLLQTVYTKLGENIGV